MSMTESYEKCLDRPCSDAALATLPAMHLSQCPEAYMRNDTDVHFVILDTWDLPSTVCTRENC